MSDEIKIDTTNKYLVALRGDYVAVMLPIRTAKMTVDEAINLAAWLVALTDKRKFEKTYEAVINT